MSLTIENMSVPIRVDDHGVARVGDTRVTLHSVIGQYKRGISPEEIAQNFDTLRLEDIYAVIAYYLRNRATVEESLQEYERAGNDLRKENEARFGLEGTRERLLSRKNGKPDS